MIRKAQMEKHILCSLHTQMNEERKLKEPYTNDKMLKFPTQRNENSSNNAKLLDMHEIGNN